MKNFVDIFWLRFEKIIERIILKLVGLFNTTISQNKIDNFIQIAKFSLVGLSNTIISYIVYLILVKINIAYMIANIGAFIVSVLNAFYWNNIYVFKKSSVNKIDMITTLIKTFISYGITGLLLSSFLLYLWIDVIGISMYIAPILNLLITIPLNFLINKFWTFK